MQSVPNADTQIQSCLLLPLTLLYPHPRLEYPNMETHPWDRKQMMLAEGTSGNVFLLHEFHTATCAFQSRFTRAVLKKLLSAK